MQRGPWGWQSGRVSNPAGLYVPLRRRSPWSSSIAHRSLDAVEGSLEVGAAPGARLIGDLVRDDAGQRAEILLSSRYLDQPYDVAGAIHEALVSGIESLDPPQRPGFGRGGLHGLHPLHRFRRGAPGWGCPDLPLRNLGQAGRP